MAKSGIDSKTRERWAREAEERRLRDERLIAERAAAEERDREQLEAFRQESLRQRTENADRMNRLALGNIALRDDGRVLTAKSVTAAVHEKYNFAGWQNIKAVSVGENHAVGLRSDGTVVAVGKNQFGQCNVSEWQGVTAISAGCEHTLGLRADGTVLCAGTKRAAFEKWTEIKAIASVGRVGVGLRRDGTIVTVGYRAMKDGLPETEAWQDIASISVYEKSLFGVRTDGTFVTTDQRFAKESAEMTDVAKVVLDHYNYLAVLRSNGTMRVPTRVELDWRNLVDLDMDGDCLIGLRADGTAIYFEPDYSTKRDVQKITECVAQWSDLVAVRIVNDGAKLWGPIGLKKDGTIVAADEKFKKEYAAWKLFPPYIVESPVQETAQPADTKKAPDAQKKPKKSAIDERVLRIVYIVLICALVYFFAFTEAGFFVTAIILIVVVVLLFLSWVFS